jgi:hypothetical protein
MHEWSFVDFQGVRSCVLRIAFSFVHVDVGFILAGWDAGASVELGTSREEGVQEYQEL